MPSFAGQVLIGASAPQPPWHRQPQQEFIFVNTATAAPALRRPSATCKSVGGGR